MAALTNLIERTKMKNSLEAKELRFARAPKKKKKKKIIKI